MGVAPGLEGLLEDEITIGVIGNHDILIARLGLDRESAGVIHVELADGKDTGEDLIGRIFGGTGWLARDNGCRWRWLRRSDVLALLGEMTQDGLVRVWAVVGCIGVREAIASVTVTCFDGFQPCMLDKET